MILFYPNKIPWQFCVTIFIRRVSGMGSQEGGTWRTLSVPDGRHGGYGHPWCHGWPWCTPRIISWKFQFDIFVFFEVIHDFWVNCEPETRERDKTRDERRVKLTLTLPGNVRQGWGKGSAISTIIMTIIIIITIWIYMMCWVPFILDDYNDYHVHITIWLLRWPCP